MRRGHLFIAAIAGLAFSAPCEHVPRMVLSPMPMESIAFHREGKGKRRRSRHEV